MTEDLTSKFKEAEKEVRAVYKVKGVIHNLHGQYLTRVQSLRSVVYSHADIEEIEKKEKEEEKKTSKLLRTKEAEVKTFPRNEKGKLLAPIGGSHGYLRGMIRAAAKMRYRDQWAKRTGKYYGLKSRIETGIFIEPEWIELGDQVSNPLDEPKRYFLTEVGTYEYYDYVDKFPFEVNITVESDIPEEVIVHLLAAIQRLGCGPKRRGRIEITKVGKLA